MRHRHKVILRRIIKESERVFGAAFQGKTVEITYRIDYDYYHHYKNGGYIDMSSRPFKTWLKMCDEFYDLGIRIHRHEYEVPKFIEWYVSVPKEIYNRLE